MNRNMFGVYADRLVRYGAAGVGMSEFELGREGKYSLKYIPLEHLNRNAKLVIVGITPGPNQLDLAYETAQKELMAGRGEPETLAEVKKHGAFGSRTMRPNLVKMLEHFGFHRILGIDDINSLWGSQAHLLHSTSIVPHAAFLAKNGKDCPFAGDFEDVMNCSLFRRCFIDCFVPSLAEINPDAMYVGLGRCPEQGLKWCVQNNYLREEQVLGAMSHPATTGGSSVGYFLREKRLEDLSPRDPVRHRVEWLDAAYTNMAKVTAHLIALT